ncbi:NUP43 isoform 2 [Pongo abelii]|uniref:NUP43 isoform 2 n=1 Tax=Pongo abelii TaxID=9601 RepID=A0A2J8XAA1_PONAB|nr:NUP43 isoform 2 [Pongo abelii]
MEEIYAKFVSQKISKTRWRPLPPGSLQTAETFATGSWDNEENYVSLWSIGDFGNLDSDGGFEGDHQLLCDIKHHGDVMDLQFFDQERIVAASSTGCVTVFLHHPNNQTLSVNQQWTTAHYHTGPGSPSYSSAPCTGVVCNNPEIVTVGEDGRINLFRADHKEAVRTIVWEVHFHPSNPDHLFTCSEDGSLWHWNASTDVPEKSSLFHQGGRSSTFLSHSISNQANVHQSVISSWLSTDPAKDRIEITSLLPSRSLSVNSLDVLGPCLVCGTDAEAIYVTRHLFS